MSGRPSPWGAQVCAILPRSAPHADACFSNLRQRQTVSLSSSMSRLFIVALLLPLVRVELLASIYKENLKLLEAVGAEARE